MKGGLRPGAGRKKGFSAIEAEKARELFVAKLSASLEEIIDTLISHAKKGDIRAIKELFDRAYGRPDSTTHNDVTPMVTLSFDPAHNNSGNSLHEPFFGK